MIYYLHYDQWSKTQIFPIDLHAIFVEMKRPKTFELVPLQDSNANVHKLCSSTSYLVDLICNSGDHMIGRKNTISEMKIAFIEYSKGRMETHTYTSILSIFSNLKTEADERKVFSEGSAQTVCIVNNICVIHASFAETGKVKNQVFTGCLEYVPMTKQYREVCHQWFEIQQVVNPPGQPPHEMKRSEVVSALIIKRKMPLVLFVSSIPLQIVIQAIKNSSLILLRIIDGRSSISKGLTGKIGDNLLVMLSTTRDRRLILFNACNTRNNYSFQNENDESLISSFVSIVW